MTSYSIFTTSDATAYNGSGFSLGMEFGATATCWLTAIRYYQASSTNSYGSPVGRLYTVTSGTAGNAVTGTDVNFGTPTAVGWQTAQLGTAIQLTSGQKYRVAVLFTAYFSATNSYWVSGGAGASNKIAGPITAYTRANATGQIQGSYTSGTSLAYPANIASPAGNNYWVDVVVSDTNPALGSGTKRAAFISFFGDY